MLCSWQNFFLLKKHPQLFWAWVFLAGLTLSSVEEGDGTRAVICVLSPPLVTIPQVIACLITFSVLSVWQNERFTSVCWEEEN